MSIFSIKSSSYLDQRNLKPRSVKKTDSHRREFLSGFNFQHFLRQKTTVWLNCQQLHGAIVYLTEMTKVCQFCKSGSTKIKQIDFLH